MSAESAHAAAPAAMSSSSTTSPATTQYPGDWKTCHQSGARKAYNGKPNGTNDITFHFCLNGQPMYSYLSRSLNDGSDLQSERHAFPIEFGRFDDHDRMIAVVPPRKRDRASASDD